MSSRPVPPSAPICESSVAQRLALYASRAEQAIFVGGADGRTEWANEAACRLCGFALEELAGRRLELFPDDADAQRSAADHIRTRFAAGEVARVEASIRTREGRVLWIELEVTPLPGAAGAARGWVAVASDISARKRAEAALAESEERYRRLVEDSSEPAAVHSEGRLVYLNRAALALLGAPSAEAVLGRSIFEFLHPDYHRLAAERILKMEVVGDPAAPVVETLLRFDGSPVDVALAATPIEWRGKPGIQLAGRALLGEAESETRAERRAAVVDLSSLVLALAPEIEDRIAPRAQVSLDLSAAPVELPKGGVPLEALIRTLVAQVSAALPRGRGSLLLRSESRELGAKELAAFVPAPDGGAGRYAVFEACAEQAELDARARERLFDPGFAERCPGCGPGLAAALAAARARGGALRVQAGACRGVRIALALPSAAPARRPTRRRRDR